MEFYDDEKNIEQYIEMCEGYDGKELLSNLEMHLAPKSTLLELGMGPGTDLDFLKNTYTVTGSDNSQAFLIRYLKNNPNADVIRLDAIKMDTSRKFNCIFSNKVLHHLTNKELKESLENQLSVLEDKGLIFHTFWKGNEEKFIHGMRFNYVNESTLKDLLATHFEILEMVSYKEMENDDSLYIIARKKS